MGNLNKLLIFISFILIFGCATIAPTTISEKNIAAIYNPSSTTIHPKLFVYNKDTENTLLYIYLYTPELLFLQTSGSTLPTSKVKIYYKIIESIDNETIIDSATTYLSIKKNATQTSMITFLKLKTVDLDKYVVQVLVKDEYRKKSNIAFIEVDNTEKFGEKNFLVSYADDLRPTFNNYAYSSENYLIEFNKNIEKLYVSYFKLDNSLPLPPFSTKFEKLIYPEADSTWALDYSGNVSFKPEKVGIYFFQTDTTVMKGKTIINFGDEYPILQKSATLLKTLEYLTTTDEFEDLSKIENKKLAVDNFWLNSTQDENQAKELIRIYYNRVMFANIYFTTYKEGWKTDRGMIYIVFGPPKIVNKKDGYEKWIYSDSKSVKTVEYEFFKRENKFTEEDYVLKRDLAQKNYWQYAIETWRGGSIFSLDY